jgi:hypothetical protein
MKASDTMRADLRSNRARSLTHLIFRIVRPHLRDDEEGRYYEREEQILSQIMRELHDLGAEVVTDETRRVAGLSPRGSDGWTMEELIALEKRRIELLTAPIIVPDKHAHLLRQAAE